MRVFFFFFFDSLRGRGDSILYFHKKPIELPLRDNIIVAASMSIFFIYFFFFFTFK
jgi:hypothetical protein